MEGAGVLLTRVFIVWLYVWLPASMATARGRSALGWVVLTRLVSPFVTIIALVVLGPTVETALSRMPAR
ncbi:MAG: hypothetical protein MUF73_13345 [Rhodobacteraceae bacterium]|jgi:hypothetical protein|nr:hypothetical protein [Paracoccaceae bacterium]